MDEKALTTLITGRPPIDMYVLEIFEQNARVSRGIAMFLEEKRQIRAKRAQASSGHSVHMRG